MRGFNGKAIYNPSGKAGEYAKWACNFYVGCSNGCEYCYCKKGILAGAMGQDAPQLKKCFRDEKQALEVFERELIQNLDSLRGHGIFFSFTTDPLLPETRMLTTACAAIAVSNGVPVKFLTKCACTDFLLNWSSLMGVARKMIAVGFTLTGHDELEPRASTNAERIEAMRKLHDLGFRTFASIEPIVTVDDSLTMIAATQGFCDLYKVGLMSGKNYERTDIWYLISELSKYAMAGRRIYIKDSVLKAVNMNRSELPDYFERRYES